MSSSTLSHRDRPRRDAWGHAALRVLTTLALCWWAMPSTAATQTLFEVRGPHAVVYLLGSVHVLKPDDSALSPEVLAAYERAADLVLELDVEAAQAALSTNEILSLARLHPGETLEKRIGAKAFRRVAKAARSLHVPVATLAPLRPWFVAIVLLSAQLTGDGYESGSGIDLQLAARAKADAKPVVGLETAAEQLGIFASLSPALERRFLLQTLGDLEAPDATMETTVSAWKHGDLAALERELGKSFQDFPELYGPVVADRNRRWMGPLSTMLAGDGEHLVVVGALHLVGRDGLVERLRERGYEVRQY